METVSIEQFSKWLMTDLERTLAKKQDFDQELRIS